jgi:hypothetical protein
MRRILIANVGAAALVCMSHATSAATLKKEPAMGALRQGQRALVDDGTCPKGQIKEVIGGNHSSVGGNAQIHRTRRCIPRK